MSTALLVIDVQHALTTGQWAAFGIDRVIDNINALIAKARRAQAPVVFIQHEEDEGPLQHGTPGWQLADGLDAQPGDLRIRKTTPDSFHRTELHEMLQKRGCDRLIVSGLQTDFCVDTTTRRALALGYAVTLPEDAHSTVDNGVLSAVQIIAHHNTTLANMTSFGPRVSVEAAKLVSIEA